MPEATSRIWRIITGQHEKHSAIARNNAEIGYIFTPDELPARVVIAAWSYALRYTAKGLDVPDYDAAAKMLVKRHPTWRFEKTIPNAECWYSPEMADDDKPDA